MILDTTFLVDFEREGRRREPGPATRFLAENEGQPVAITFTIAGELAAGESLGGTRLQWEEFLRPFEVLTYTSDVAWRFGSIYRFLKNQGALIGANDIWIAATALAYNVPLVTRNATDFTRIDGLDVRGY